MALFKGGRYMKDAYWFTHDCNAKDDTKTTLLIEQLGLEGYGIFWILVEILRDQPNYKYPLILLPSIARKYNTTHEKVKAVVLSYNLFVIENNEFFFSQSLNERMLKLDNKREQARLAGLSSARKRLESRNEIPTDVERTLNGGSTPVQLEQNSIEQNNIIKKNTLLSEINISDVPEKLVIFYKTALSFQKLFIANLKEIDLINTSPEKAKFLEYVTPIRLMIEIDKRTNDEIKQVYNFLKKDLFWKRNILSTSKLRAKFEKLLIESRKESYKLFNDTFTGERDGKCFVNGVPASKDQLTLYLRQHDNSI